MQRLFVDIYVFQVDILSMFISVFVFSKEESGCLENDMIYYIIKIVKRYIFVLIDFKSCIQLFIKYMLYYYFEESCKR